jgi:signal transduction histidine kinase
LSDVRSERVESAEEDGSPTTFDANTWEEIKEFLDFREEDAERLRAARAQYETELQGIVERFYEHLKANPATSTLLSSPQVVERLKEQQRRYLLSLSGGEYGEAYLAERMRIGLAHERIGLEPRWYLGSYWLYQRELIGRLVPSAPEEERARWLSMQKILLLDMILVSESYIGHALSLVQDQKERLERIVHERTRQLSKWERLAAVGSLAAKVAHEIRNPLSSISLNTELLSDELVGYSGVDNREALDLLQAIAGEIDRLSRIVEEYLQFARMPRLELEQVDLVEIAEQVLKFLAPEFARSEIETEIDASGEGLALYLDQNQFRQVLLNLLRNSQEAMLDGGRITIHIREEADGAVELVVADTGVGIEPVEAHKVFDPFYSTKDTGTGLGLAFVQQVIIEHGGEVNCTGQPGRGAAVKLLLPERLRVRPPVPPTES